MKGVIFLLTICEIGIFLAAGCSCPMKGPQMVTFKNEKIYKWQSTESVERSLGSPEVVSKGPFTKNMWAGGVLMTPDMSAVEWVYFDGPNSLILWIENNYVVRVGIAQTRKIIF